MNYAFIVVTRLDFYHDTFVFNQDKNKCRIFFDLPRCKKKKFISITIFYVYPENDEKILKNSKIFLKIF